MLRIPRRHRIWIFLLALWLAFEPITVTVLRAETAPNVPLPKPVTSKIKGLESADQAAKPDEVLEGLLATQGILTSDQKNGKIVGAAATKAYADFLMMTSSAYDLMGEGEADCITFMGCLKSIQELGGFGEVKDAWGALDVVKYGNIPAQTGKHMIAAFSRMSKTLFTFFNKAKSNTDAKWKKNVLACFANGAKRLNKCAKVLKNLGDFLDSMEPPNGWDATKNLYKFCRTGRNAAGHAGELNKAKAAGHCVGIALSVLTIVVEGYSLATDEDMKAGMGGTWKNVKSIANIAVAAMAIVGMFLFPFGTIATIAGIVVLIASYIGDKLGEFNAKWKAAYKRSWDFLMKEDKEFKYFAEVCLNNPSLADAKLPVNRRSVSWRKADKDYSVWKKGVTDPEKLKRIEGLYLACKKAGILATYYNRLKFGLPAMDMSQLQDLWNKKASYMSHVPTEKELKEEKEKGFFSKALEVVNPFNWFMAPVNMVKEYADKRAYEKSKGTNILPVYYNPDYVLMKRYQYFLAEKPNRKGGLYDLVGLRVQQAPFNYIWLVGLPDWDASKDGGLKLILDALEGDVFFCGIKEMQYFQKQMEVTLETMKKAEEEQKNIKVGTREFLEKIPKQIQALDALIDVYEQEKNENYDYSRSWQPGDQKYEKIWKPAAKAFNWKAEHFGAYNDVAPENRKVPPMNSKTIFNRYRAEIEQRLAFIPLSINEQANTMKKLDLTIKSCLDRHALLKRLGKDKQEILDNFDKNYEKAVPAMWRYLAKNEFLGVGGKWNAFMDWLSDIKPAKEEMQKYVNLYMKAVDEYGEIVNGLSNQTTGIIWWKKELPNPDEAIVKLNDALKQVKEVIKKYEDMKNDTDLTVKITDECWFPNHELPFGKEKRKALDPDDEKMDMEKIAASLEGDEVNADVVGAD